MRLSRKDRDALIVIAGIVVAVNIGIYIIKCNFSEQGHTSAYGYPTLSDSATNNAQPAVTKLFVFDPNTTDSATFVSLGLKPHVARAIMHYRMAGGRFHTADDFSRIYTLKDSDFQRLKPYIRITQSNNPLSSKTGAKNKRHIASTHSEATSAKANDDSSNHYYHHIYPSAKLHRGQTVDIATADTTQLRRIPGIGAYYANKIIKYRERMGGFVNLAQLEEINGLPQDIMQWVTLQKTEVVKLLVNSFTFGQLLRHPYLNFDQVAAIFNYRKHYGDLHSLNDLKSYAVFSAAELSRLAPYVDFSHP